MVIKLNLLSKKHDSPFSFNNEVFGKDGEKKIGRTKIIFNKILEFQTVSIENPCGIVQIDNQPHGLNAPTLLHNTQQPTKKIDIQKNSRALLAVELPLHLVSNTYAKPIMEVPESKEGIFVSPRGQSGSGVQATNQAEKTQTGTRKTTQKTRPKSKSGLTSSEEKNVGKQYLKGPALFRNSVQFVLFAQNCNTEQFVLW